MFQKIKRKFDYYFLVLRAFGSRRRARTSDISLTKIETDLLNTSDFTASTVCKQAERRERKNTEFHTNIWTAGRGQAEFEESEKGRNSCSMVGTKYHEECHMGHVGSGKVDRGWPFTLESD